MKNIFFITLLSLLFASQLVGQDNPFDIGINTAKNQIVTPPKLYISPFYSYGVGGWGDGYDERISKFGANLGWRFQETRPTMLMTGLNYIKFTPNTSEEGSKVLQIPLIVKASSLSVKRKSGITAELGVTASFLLNADNLEFSEASYEYNKSYVGGLTGIGYRFDIGRTGLELFCRYQSSWTKAATSHHKIWSGGEEISESVRVKLFTFGIMTHIPIL